MPLSVVNISDDGNKKKVLCTDQTKVELSGLNEKHVC